MQATSSPQEGRTPNEVSYDGRRRCEDSHSTSSTQTAAHSMVMENEEEGQYEDDTDCKCYKWLFILETALVCLIMLCPIATIIISSII